MYCALTLQVMYASLFASDSVWYRCRILSSPHSNEVIQLGIFAMSLYLFRGVISHFQSHIHCTESALPSMQQDL